MSGMIEAAEICAAQLRDICTAAGLVDQQDEVIALFSIFCASAGLCRVPARPRWSGVTDDCTPIEFSTSFDSSGIRVRFLLEAQADPASAVAYWTAGERLYDRLAAEVSGVNLEPMLAVRDLFRPTDPTALFAIWHALDFRNNGPPLCKTYFNPAARGRQSAPRLVASALERLGFGRAIQAFLESLAGDVITHLAIDLVSSAHARVKIYARHFRAVPAEFDYRAQRLGIATGTAFADACQIICTGCDSLQHRPVMTCYHLTASDPSRPTAMTLYLPLYPYAPSDRLAAARITALLVRVGMDVERYLRVAKALISRRGDGDGLHTYLGYRLSAGQSEVDQITTYFNPSLFQRQFGRLALDPDRFWPSALRAA